MSTHPVLSQKIQAPRKVTPTDSEYRRLLKTAQSRTKELEKLSTTQDKTKKAMLNVLEDLEEARVTIEVKTAREKEIDRAKSEFVSLASHQLRTPLGIIKWYLEALESESEFSRVPATIRKYFAEIYKSNERVLNLVRDLLSVSRIEQGLNQNVLEPVNPIPIVKEMVEQMQILADQKNISLDLRVPRQNTALLALHSLRFREVLENLICNAISYSHDSGTVEIHIQSSAITVTLSIKDTGIGISLADQKKLYTKFFRSEEAMRHNPEGSGLGLYLVKFYVESWGGTVSAISVLGKGSTFTLTFPVAKKVAKKRKIRI